MNIGSLDFWYIVTISAASLGQTSFVALYVTFPWWQSRLGRALFLFAAGLATLVDTAAVGIVWDWPFERGTIITLYGVVALGIWAQLIAFLRVRRRGDSL